MPEGTAVSVPKWFLAVASIVLGAAIPWAAWVSTAITSINVRMEFHSNLRADFTELRAELDQLRARHAELRTEIEVLKQRNLREEARRFREEGMGQFKSLADAILTGVPILAMSLVPK